MSRRIDNRGAVLTVGAEESGGNLKQNPMTFFRVATEAIVQDHSYSVSFLTLHALPIVALLT